MIRGLTRIQKLFGVGTIPWSPLSRGLLSRPVASHGNTVRASTDPFIRVLHKEDDPNFATISRFVNYIGDMRGSR
jgi:aryl-alcohol dehydrogenase-like predicted oxidoreductase